MMNEQKPPQSQRPPGVTSDMQPPPRDEMRDYRGGGLLEGQRALVSGGDSGIGRAVAIGFAKEGADVAIAYLNEHDDARHTEELVVAQGRRSLKLPGDLASQEQCRKIVADTVEEFGGVDILVNNIATQRPVESPDELDDAQWTHTFDVNMHSYYRVTAAALPHLPPGSCIINTGSVNGLRGNKSLIDYSATKGAIHAWTYSMGQALVERGIRVNCVAPGPVWTPLIPATLGEDRVSGFGGQAPYGRAAEPDELAPSYIFFASNKLSSYYTGATLSALGGETLPGA